MRVGFAFGAGGDDLRPAGFAQDRPTEFFDGAAETGFAVAAIVEFADADAGGGDGWWDLASGV